MMTHTHPQYITHVQFMMTRHILLHIYTIRHELYITYIYIRNYIHAYIHRIVIMLHVQFMMTRRAAIPHMRSAMLRSLRVYDTVIR